jgi:acetyl-CoA carboxylase biotin carboxylase subunit
VFKKILIVNRGEIALRIIRACKEMGIVSAALYSDPDKFSMHVRQADEAYHLPGIAPRETYLNIPLIIDIAKRIEADAIHPGYGFLSENAAFIKAVEKSGITFIGPSAKSVEMMGSKTAARQLMKANNVPIVPGTTAPVTSIAEGKRVAAEITYPVLLKASAGGGGKGMKKVFSEAEFEEAFLSAQREALKAFGDDSVYIEKLIVQPKHIEVQIIADKQGHYAHLFERECSVQRRHQKIIEEAPSSFVDQETREQLTQAAINAAKACDYYNAGTIEFLMDKDRKFYFLEMNTRLQVEHPVTEWISGIDLVREQIQIANGQVLSFSQKDLKINGHALEARVYAEDPANNFLPTTGYIPYHRVPSGPGIRTDAGVELGTEIGVHYDPLLTKISTWAPDRESAIKKMEYALSTYIISGLTTNIPLLKWILLQNSFVSGNYSIDFIDEEFLSKDPVKILQDFSASFSDVAAVFGVLYKMLKTSPPCGQTNSQGSENLNQWTGQLYE